MRPEGRVVAVYVAISDQADARWAAVGVDANAAVGRRRCDVAPAAITPDSKAVVRCVRVNTVAVGVVRRRARRAEYRVVRVSGILLVLLVALDGGPGALTCCRGARIAPDTRSAHSCPGGRAADTEQTGARVVAAEARDTGEHVRANRLHAVDVGGAVDALVGVKPQDRARRETGVRLHSRLCIRRVQGTACPRERREHVLRLGEDEAARDAGSAGGRDLGEKGAARHGPGVHDGGSQVAGRVLELRRPGLGASRPLLSLRGSILELGEAVQKVG